MGARSIEINGGRVTGVVTTEGDRVQAPSVISACHILTTLELAESGLPDGLAERARGAIRVGNGIGVALRLGTSELPAYPDAPEDVHHGLGIIARDRQVLASAHGDYQAGRPPAKPPVLVMGFSALDPTLAPPGRHSVTVWGQWYPYELNQRAGAPASWEAGRQETIDRLVAAVDEAAPGFSGRVEHAALQTPEDLESELGLRRGNVMHVEMSLPSMFGWRPLPELSGYRTPVTGLYLAGASTHPGGGVSGASGRSAARVLLADHERGSGLRRILKRGRASRPGTS